MVTVKISDTAELVRALRDLALGIQNGKVASASLHYDPTGIARLSVCYVTSRHEGGDSELPGLPDVDEEETQPC